MFSPNIGSSSAGFFGMSNNQFTQIKNKQAQNHMLGLLSGMPSIKGGMGSPLSAGFLYQVYDSKAMSPQVVNNYLKKVDEVTGGGSEQGPPVRTTDYQSFVDKILEEEDKGEDVNTSTPEAENSEVLETENTDNDHYGIVGEIFDKYA